MAKKLSNKMIFKLSWFIGKWDICIYTIYIFLTLFFLKKILHENVRYLRKVCLNINIFQKLKYFTKIEHYF